MYLVCSLQGELKTASEEHTDAFSPCKDMGGGAPQLPVATTSITQKNVLLPKFFYPPGFMHEIYIS